MRDVPIIPMGEDPDALQRTLADLGLVLGPAKKIASKAERVATARAKSAEIDKAQAAIDQAAAEHGRLEERLSAFRRELEVLRGPSARGLGVVPQAFVCPVSLEIMENPVFAMDGHSYEKLEITRWLETKATSPTTGAPLKNKELVENHSLRGQIRQFIEECKARGADASTMPTEADVPRPGL